MKQEKAMLIDRYLAGEAPIHPERLVPPTDEELKESEIVFDQMVAKRQQNITTIKKDRIISLWPWAAAACFLITISTVLWTLFPEDKQPEQPQQKAVAEIITPAQSTLPQPDEPTTEEPQQAVPTNSNLHKKTAKSATSLHQAQQTFPKETTVDMPEIDLAAEVASIQEMVPIDEFPVQSPISLRRDDLSRRIKESFPPTIELLIPQNM